jgi:hypothetical protein
VDESEPVTVDLDEPVGLEGLDRERTQLDREELRDHRAELLSLQGLSPEQLPAIASPRSAWRELALALIYTLYVIPVSCVVLKYARSFQELFAAGALVFFAGLFLVSFWRSYGRSARLARRTRMYTGVLVEKRPGGRAGGTVAVFEGGSIILPAPCHRQLVLGVRYRVHAPGTEDVAIDVDVDEALRDAEPTAYRSPTR